MYSNVYFTSLLPFLCLCSISHCFQPQLCFTSSFLILTFALSSVNHVSGFRYMFAFQLPLLPELAMKADDMHMLGSVYTSPETGLKRNKLTADEIEAFKYSIGTGEGEAALWSCVSVVQEI